MHIPPLFVTVGCTCASEGWGGGVRVDTRLCISVAELRVRSTSGWLGGVCAVCHFWVCDSTTCMHTHPHAHTQTHARTCCELTCCRAAGESASHTKQWRRRQQQQQPRHTGALLHKQTNTPAAPGKSLWQSAEGGKANKTNSLIYMTVPCFTLACRGNDRVKLCGKQQVMKSDGPICGIV